MYTVCLSVPIGFVFGTVHVREYALLTGLPTMQTEVATKARNRLSPRGGSAILGVFEKFSEPKTPKVAQKTQN